jgi:putative membrane protein
MRWFHLTTIVVFVAAIIVFAAQNLEVVEVSFLRMSVHMRLAFLIAIIYLLGAATGGSLLALLRRSYTAARQRPTVAT